MHKSPLAPIWGSSILDKKNRFLRHFFPKNALFLGVPRKNGQKTPTFPKTTLFFEKFVIPQRPAGIPQAQVLSIKFFQNHQFSKVHCLRSQLFRKSADPPLQGGRFLNFFDSARCGDFYHKNVIFSRARSGVSKIAIFSDF